MMNEPTVLEASPKTIETPKPMVLRQPDDRLKVEHAGLVSTLEAKLAADGNGRSILNEIATLDSVTPTIEVSHIDKDTKDEPESIAVHQQYKDYVSVRRELQENAIKLSTDHPDSLEAIIALNEYHLKYGTTPDQDEFFEQQAETRDKLFEILNRGDGARVYLPVIVGEKPFVISVHKITPDLDDPTTARAVKYANKRGMEGDNIVQDMIAGKETARFYVDIGYEMQDGTLKSYGKSDFYIRQEDGGERIAYGGAAQDNMPLLLADKVDRNLVRTTATTTLRTDSDFLKQNQRAGLGRTLYSIGRYLASQSGANERIVEMDGTLQNNDPNKSFYVDVSTGLGASLEERIVPPLGQKKLVPVFDTKGKNPPFQFGYWLPELKESSLGEESTS